MPHYVIVREEIESKWEHIGGHKSSSTAAGYSHISALKIAQAESHHRRHAVHTTEMFSHAGNRSCLDIQ
jgi:hypothetical protein